jgi:glutamine cyclotransferase
VLNGIAYDPKKKTMYITGKLWPEIFEIRVD